MILITGSSGFIGTNFIIYLNKKGIDNIIGVDFKERYEKDIKISEFYNVNNFNILNHPIERIYHIGAFSNTNSTDVELLKKWNYQYSEDLLSYASRNNIPITYASSASVYGKNPNTIVSPCNLYALYKAQLDNFAEYLINTTDSIIQGLRFFNVHGDYEDHKDQPSPHTKFKRQFENSGKIRLFENSDEYLRDFINVEKVCEVMFLLYYSNYKGIMDVGTGNPQSFEDVALSICKSRDYIEYINMPEDIKKHYQIYTCAKMKT